MPDKPNFFERLRGKRYHDIQLPQEGERDPKLPGDKLAQMKQGLETLRKNQAYRDRVNKRVK